MAIKEPSVMSRLPSDLALVEGAGPEVPCAEVLGTMEESTVEESTVEEILEVIIEVMTAVEFATVTGPKVAGRAVAGS